jgi:hypothetical protein
VRQCSRFGQWRSARTKIVTVRSQARSPSGFRREGGQEAVDLGPHRTPVLGFRLRGTAEIELYRRAGSLVTVEFESESNSPMPWPAPS